MARLSKMSFSALLLLVLTALGACNTVKGMGQDVEAGGEAISDTAEKIQDKM